MFLRITVILLFLLSQLVMAQDNTNHNKFRQLGQELPTPNSIRTASGAPGADYWQQRADYDIAVELDDESQRITGSETITYHNYSPDRLDYIWLQLDQNVRAVGSDAELTGTMSLPDSLTFKQLRQLHGGFDGGFKIDAVTDAAGRALRYTVNSTMMRVDLPAALKPGASYSFKVRWWYNINDRMEIGGRSGYEYFKADDNYAYTIAQFYPRVAMYNDVEGWQHKQFLGRGEFTLVFGDYTLRITVPADHVVAASGELQNAAQVLTAAQRSRLQKARKASQPVLIVTPEEAAEAEKQRSKRKATWIYKADNVRDVAWASSRKYIWDAMGVTFGARTVLAMSYYPREGNPLWGQYSTEVVAHTLRWYSKYTFDYPYPVAISVHARSIGMEYPMICFNFGRPQPDGTYTERVKYGMIGVIIHEVGHNYFPMIVNSDERQWTWMDEGLNSFLQYLTEQAWERDYPSRRGPAYKIVDYMKGDKSNIAPIMTNSESIFQFGNNAYGKPATALNILRETVMGRELFDFAFKTYAQRWMFKHPTPADLFRTMEDASGVDLDWFWRGWFYTTDHVDIAIDKVELFKVDTRDPDIEKPLARAREKADDKFIGDLRNRTAISATRVEENPELADFYTTYDPHEVSVLDRADFKKYSEKLEQRDLSYLNKEMNYYQVQFSNIGGLVMPLILEFEYADGNTERRHIPAEIWRMNDRQVSKVFATKKEIVRITLDPNLELADTDVNNNSWPAKAIPSRFKLFKEKDRDAIDENPMQRARRAAEAEATPAAEPVEEQK